MSHEQINVDIMAYSENELTPHKKMSSARCLFLLKRWLSKCQQPEKHRSHIFVKFVVTSTCVLSLRIYIYIFCFCYGPGTILVSEAEERTKQVHS